MNFDLFLCNHFAHFVVCTSCCQKNLLLKLTIALGQCLEDELNEELFQGAPVRPQLCICSALVHLELFGPSASIYLSIYPASQTNPSAGIADSCL